MTTKILRSVMFHCYSNTRGVATIELAMCAPFLALLIAGVIDLSRAYAERATLHSAATRTLEVAQATASISDYDALKSEAAAAAKVSLSDVTLEKWLECSGTKADFNASCAENQEVARYVQLRIQSKYEPVVGHSLIGLPNPVTIKVMETLRIQ